MVLASACKVMGTEQTAGGSFRFYAEGPAKTEASVRVALPGKPGQVTLDRTPLPAEARTWDAATKSLLLHFPNSATGHWLEIGKIEPRS